MTGLPAGTAKDCAENTAPEVRDGPPGAEWTGAVRRCEPTGAGLHWRGRLVELIIPRLLAE